METLLYRAAVQGELDSLMPLARKFASSNDHKIRRPMIYFSGGPFEYREARTLGACEELLGVLVDHECSDSLDPLVWKLLQSAAVFGSATARLATLCHRCGFDAVNRAVSRAYAPEGIEIVRSEWSKLPEELRTALPALREG